MYLNDMLHPQYCCILNIVIFTRHCFDLHLIHYLREKNKKENQIQVEELNILPSLIIACTMLVVYFFLDLVFVCGNILNTIILLFKKPVYYAERQML